MQVLVANSHKRTYFIAENIKDHKFARFYITRNNHFCKWLVTFTDEVNVFTSYFKVGHWYESEFTPFVKHVHRSIKARFNVVGDIISANSNFVHKTGELGATSSCVYWRHNVVV